MAGAGRRSGSRRTAVWAALAALVLTPPLVAMRVTDDVAWDLADFVLAGSLVAGAGLVFELAARMRGGGAYRAAVGVAAAAGSMLVWSNLAVGVIGSEDERANLLFFAVPMVGLVGAAFARLRPKGMARAMVATASAQALVPVIALAVGPHPAGPVEPLDVSMVTGFFGALWLASAWLFRKAARMDADEGGAAGGAPGPRSG